MLVGFLVIQPKHSGDFMSVALETDFTCYFLYVKHLLFCFHCIDSLRAVKTTSCTGYRLVPAVSKC